MRSPTKAMMARELDSLRHRVSQLEADNTRLRAQLASTPSHRLQDQTPVSLRQLAMQQAREEAMRTGRSVRVQL